MKKIQYVLLVAFLVLSPIAAALQANYSTNTCPNLESIVHDAVKGQMALSVKTAPATLRLFFHDCFVRGMTNGTMLMTSIALNKEGFDTVSTAKKAIDKDPRCINKVSCADILALAARDAVSLSGGPSWPVELGRYDGKVSTKDSVVLPHADNNLDELTKLFTGIGLNQTDMIALSGGHTFGVARCLFFKNHLYPKTDPAMDPAFAKQVKAMCPLPGDNFTTGAFLDFTTKGTFDNVYYKNLQNGRGLLASDQILYTDSRSRDKVNLFASNQKAFFQSFTEAMIKLGRVGVKTASDGEIRRDCRFPN